jgi:hypothetical protein
MGIDFFTFGNGSLSPVEEDRVLGYFACYVVTHPRDGRLHNTKGHADVCLSAVRASVQRCFDRRRGRVPAEAVGLILVLKGLATFAPSGARRVVQPIMQEHLRLVKDYLDLRNNQVPPSHLSFCLFLACLISFARSL